MKAVDNVGVTFVNAIIGRGTLNNVVNIQFGTYLFTPGEEKVEPDLAVSCRLRMDRACAVQLYETLGSLIETIAREEAALSEEEASSAPAQTH